MSIFSVDTFDFFIIDVFLEEWIIISSSNLSSRTDLAINFDLAKGITKTNIPKL